ncbi:MAG: ComF family protein, partial [Patescibacteria group bacterium]
DAFSLDTRLVRRVRDTPPQTKLGRNARLSNIDGAFVLTGALTSNCTYIVIDDVTTTGSTLRAVLQAIPGKVLGISLAH